MNTHHESEGAPDVKEVFFLIPGKTDIQCSHSLDDEIRESHNSAKHVLLVHRNAILRLKCWSVATRDMPDARVEEAELLRCNHGAAAVLKAMKR